MFNFLSFFLNMFVSLLGLNLMFIFFYLIFFTNKTNLLIQFSLTFLDATWTTHLMFTTVALFILFHISLGLSNMLKNWNS